jgi:hypothetical protein
MEAIKHTVSAVLAQLTAEHGKALEDGPAVWLQKVFTKKELEHIGFQYYRKQVLGLTADSSTWLYHLNLRKEELLVRFRRVAPEVKEMRVRLGRAQNSCCKARGK